MTVRAQLAQDIEGEYELIRDALKDAISGTRKVWLSCPDCGKRSEVEAPDVSGRMKAIELWLTEGFGKPGTTSSAPAVPDMGKPMSELTDEELDAIIAMGDGDRDANSLKGVDWAGRARMKPPPNPLFRKAGAT